MDDFQQGEQHEEAGDPLQSREGKNSQWQQQLQQQEHADASLLDVMKEWSGSTSVHGVLFALDGVNFYRWKRTMWAVIVCCAFAAMITQLTFLVQEYREFNLTVSSETSIPPALPFPQVTVCNVNIFNTYLQEETGIIEPIDDNELSMISTPLLEFIEYTEFNAGVYNGTQELKEVWEPIITPAGLCFKFETDEKIFKPGYSSGLHFWAWLNQDAYERRTEGAGLVVFITQRGSQITDQTPNVMLPPGIDSYIGIQSIEYERVTESPWSRCRSQQAQYYTQELCRSQCLDASIREACDCRNIGDPVAPELPYCQASDWKTCAAVLPNEEEVLGECDCALPPCSEKLYPTRVDVRAYSQQFLNNQKVLHNTSSEEFLANFVGVTINFDVIRSQVVKESKATTFAQLLSSIGGTMGLFAGISVISTFEIFGDLFLLRILPRLWGDRRLHGVGSKTL